MADVEKIRKIATELHLIDRFSKDDGIKELWAGIGFCKDLASKGDQVGANARILLGIFSGLACGLSLTEINEVLRVHQLSEIDTNFSSVVCDVLEKFHSDIHCYHDAELIVRRIVFSAIDYDDKIGEVISDASLKAKFLESVLGGMNTDNLTMIYEKVVSMWEYHKYEYAEVGGNLPFAFEEINKDNDLSMFDKMLLLCAAMDICLNLYGVGDISPFKYLQDHMAEVTGVTPQENPDVTNLLDFLDQINQKIPDSDKINADQIITRKPEPPSVPTIDQPEEKFNSFLTDDAISFLNKLGLNDDQDRDDSNQERKEE